MQAGTFIQKIIFPIAGYIVDNVRWNTSKFFADFNDDLFAGTYHKWGCYYYKIVEKSLDGCLFSIRIFLTESICKSNIYN